jgi:uncharacterized protein
MPTYQFVLRLAALLLLTTLSLHARQLPSAIITDPTPDKDYPAKSEAPDIFSHGSRLNTAFYLASGPAPHPTVLLLHGFPGNEKNLDLAYMLQRAGWNVLFPNYRGSWGSAGNFSFMNAIEDTQSCLNFLRDPENAKKYRIDPNRILPIGHSMGGLMAANVAAHNPDVYALVMLAAWNLAGEVSGPMKPTRTDTFVNASPRLGGTTPDGLIAEAKQHADQLNYVDYASQLKTRPVLIVEVNDHNTNDNREMAEALRKAGNPHVTETYIESDHVSSNHRIALQVAILNWLQSLPAPEAK